MSGWFALMRGITEHPVFHGKPERLAVWIWLLDNAAYKATQHDVSGRFVQVPRGAVCASTRHIAGKVGVGHQVVRTALKVFETQHMINTDPTQGKNLISVCNYDKYQAPKNTDNTAPNTEPTQSQHTPNTQKKQRNKETISSYEDDTSEAIQIWNDFAVQTGWPQTKGAPSKARASAVSARIKDVGLDGWADAIARAAQSSFLTGKSDRPFSATLDWVSKPANFTKIIEGNYDDRVNPNPPSGNGGRSGPHNSLMAGFASFANSDRGAGDGNNGGGETSFDPGHEAMDSRQDRNPAPAIFRIVGS